MLNALPTEMISKSIRQTTKRLTEEDGLLALELVGERVLNRGEDLSTNGRAGFAPSGGEAKQACGREKGWGRPRPR
jgi:hypothetical protein